MNIYYVDCRVKQARSTSDDFAYGRLDVPAHNAIHAAAKVMTQDLPDDGRMKDTVFIVDVTDSGKIYKGRSVGLTSIGEEPVPREPRNRWYVRLALENNLVYAWTGYAYNACQAVEGAIMESQRAYIIEGARRPIQRSIALLYAENVPTAYVAGSRYLD